MILAKLISLSKINSIRLNSTFQVMLGKEGGFCKLLGEELGRTLFCHHCLAHRIQLILKNVQCPECELLEKFNNAVANYYGRSGRRKKHLRQFCKANSYQEFIPKPTFPVRWVQSHAQSNEIMYDNFLPLVLHLQNIKRDRRFRRDRKTQDLTPQLVRYIVQKNVQTTLCLVLDTQMGFKGVSEAFQVR